MFFPDFLDKVNSVKEWNDRLHELNRKLEPYEDILPDYVRNAVDRITTNTDLAELRKKYLRSYPIYLGTSKQNY